MKGMRVLLKFEIRCDVDAAWRAIHSPAVMAEIATPLISVSPLDAMPTQWASGSNATVELRAGGVVPVGKQLINISDRERTHEGARVRILRDTGIPLSGPLASLDVWDHQIAVSAVPGHSNRTLWRDRLVIAGPTAPLLWPAVWSAWQWRMQRIKRLAPTWAYDAEWDDEGPYG